MKNFRPYQAFEEQSVVVVSRDILQECNHTLESLMESLQSYDEDVPVTFLQNVVIPQADGVKETLYSYVLSPRKYEEATINGHVVLSNTTLGNVQHYINPVIGWARVLVQRNTALPVNSIASWVAQLRRTRDTLVFGLRRSQ